MGRLTYHLNKGILILPNGTELKVSEFVIETSDPIVLKDAKGVAYHSEPSKDPVRISFKEDQDG